MWLHSLEKTHLETWRFLLCGKEQPLIDNYEMLQIIHVNSVYLFNYLYQGTGKEPNSIYFAILY